MAYDRTKLSVSQTLRPSTRAPCVLRRKPSLCNELRRLGASAFHDHHSGYSMIPLAHADKEAHHRYAVGEKHIPDTANRSLQEPGIICLYMYMYTYKHDVADADNAFVYYATNLADAADASV